MRTQQLLSLDLAVQGEVLFVITTLFVNTTPYTSWLIRSSHFFRYVKPLSEFPTADMVIVPHRDCVESIISLRCPSLGEHFTEALTRSKVDNDWMVIFVQHDIIRVNIVSLWAISKECRWETPARIPLKQEALSSGFWSWMPMRSAKFDG